MLQVTRTRRFHQYTCWTAISRCIFVDFIHGLSKGLTATPPPSILMVEVPENELNNSYTHPTKKLVCGLSGLIRYHKNKPYNDILTFQAKYGTKSKAVSTTFIWSLQCTGSSIPPNATIQIIYIWAMWRREDGLLGSIRKYTLTIFSWQWWWPTTAALLLPQLLNISEPVANVLL